jgi:leucyl aminopeptidase
VPEDWEEFEADDGSNYYKQRTTGKLVWQHPLSEEYRDLYHQLKVCDLYWPGRPSSRALSLAAALFCGHA